MSVVNQGERSLNVDKLLLIDGHCLYQDNFFIIIIQGHSHQSPVPQIQSVPTGDTPDHDFESAAFSQGFDTLNIFLKSNKTS